MKKIFLPLLALCTIVTGLTLTSCGGGGGGTEGYTGKVYTFQHSFAVMKIDFESRMGDSNSYKGWVCYKDNTGDRGSFSNTDSCTITLKPEGEGVSITVTGQSPTSLTENAVLAFLGQEIQNANNNNNANGVTFTFRIQAPKGLPKTNNEGPTDGTLQVIQLTPEDEIEPDDDENTDTITVVSTVDIEILRLQ